MNFILSERLSLTTESSASHYGIPVLRSVVDGKTEDLGPGDYFSTKLGRMSAGEIVAGWKNNTARSEEERKAATSFLRQWPQGPQ